MPFAAAPHKLAQMWRICLEQPALGIRTRGYALRVTVHACMQSMERPDEEEEEITARETKMALDRLVAGKISAAQPKTLPSQPGNATYIKYTPSQQGAQYNSGAKERIIKMQVGGVASLQSARC